MSRKITRYICGEFPRAWAGDALALVHIFSRVIGSYTRGVIIESIIVGVITGLGYYLIGVQVWLPLGVIAFIGEIVPIIGPWIAFFISLPVILATQPDKAVLALGLFVVIPDSGGLVPGAAHSGRLGQLHTVGDAARARRRRRHRRSAGGDPGATRGGAHARHMPFTRPIAREGARPRKPCPQLPSFGRHEMKGTPSLGDSLRAGDGVMRGGVQGGEAATAGRTLDSRLPPSDFPLSSASSSSRASLLALLAQIIPGFSFSDPVAVDSGGDR